MNIEEHITEYVFMITSGDRVYERTSCRTLGVLRLFPRNLTIQVAESQSPTDYKVDNITADTFRASETILHGPWTKRWTYGFWGADSWLRGRPKSHPPRFRNPMNYKESDVLVTETLMRRCLSGPNAAPKFERRIRRRRSTG